MPSLTEYIYQLLDETLKTDITECEFWDMTIGEIDRYMKAYQWKIKYKLRTTASMNYNNTLFLLEGIGMILSGKNKKLPTLPKLYPELFDEDEIQEQKDTKSINNFLAFAHQFNAKYKSESED